MPGKPAGFWVQYDVDFYLDRREPEWREPEARRRIRYVAGSGGRFVFVHAVEALDVVTALERKDNLATASTASIDWPPRWRLR